MIFDRPCEELDVETTTSFSGQPSEGRMTLGRVNWRFFSQPPPFYWFYWFYWFLPHAMHANFLVCVAKFPVSTDVD